MTEDSKTTSPAPPIQSTAQTSTPCPDDPALDLLDSPLDEDLPPSADEPSQAELDLSKRGSVDIRPDPPSALEVSSCRVLDVLSNRRPIESCPLLVAWKGWLERGFPESFFGPLDDRDVAAAACRVTGKKVAREDCVYLLRRVLFVPRRRGNWGASRRKVQRYVLRPFLTERAAWNRAFWSHPVDHPGTVESMVQARMKGGVPKGRPPADAQVRRLAAMGPTDTSTLEPYKTWRGWLLNGFPPELQGWFFTRDACSLFPYPGVGKRSLGFFLKRVVKLERGRRGPGGQNLTAERYRVGTLAEERERWNTVFPLDQLPLTS